MTGIDVEAIRKRHAQWNERANADWTNQLFEDEANQAHRDRAQLLALLPAESTGIAQVGEITWEEIAKIICAREYCHEEHPCDRNPVCKCSRGLQVYGRQARNILALLRTKAAPATQQAGDEQLRDRLAHILWQYRDSVIAGNSIVVVDAFLRELGLRSTPPAAAADGATTREELEAIIKPHMPRSLCNMDSIIEALISARLVTVSDGAKP